MVATVPRRASECFNHHLEHEFASAFTVLIDEEDNYRFSDWVVLPNSTMVLWDYFDPGKTGSILDLDGAAIAGKPCASTTSQRAAASYAIRAGSFVN